MHVVPATGLDTPGSQQRKEPLLACCGLSLCEGSEEGGRVEGRIGSEESRAVIEAVAFGPMLVEKVLRGSLGE